jgi:hypothetical protein
MKTASIEVTLINDKENLLERAASYLRQARVGNP